MTQPNSQGKTLWEMLMEKVRGNNNNGHSAPVSFNNPMELRVGSPMPMAFANGPELADHNFTVHEIREYVRRMGGQEFEFTDYMLSGVHTKTFDLDKTLTLRLRVIPNEAGGQEKLLLKLYDEFGFAQDFLEVVKDPSGVFEATDDDGTAAVFERINGLRESYEAAVLVISETTPEGQAAPKRTSTVKVEYWDYWRDMDFGPGNTTKEFVFVELNSETGWFQIWRGQGVLCVIELKDTLTHEKGMDNDSAASS